MSRRHASLVFLLAFAMVPLVLAQSDLPGSRDYPAISRMPGYFINNYKETEFDSVKFPVTQNGQRTEQEIEGRTIKIEYRLKDNAPAASMLQIIRNFQDAARAAGGQVLDESRDPSFYTTTLRISKNGKEVWVLIGAMDNGYDQSVVERQAMPQAITMDAAGMASGLSSSGSVALYGIYFDSAKSDLKPESEPTLAEIAKLLKQQPALKVFIVGHTDMVGDPAANLKLSQARAQSVITALVTKYGIADSRLTAFGNGPYAPVASNKTEEGRAKNRRVELVEFATR